MPSIKHLLASDQVSASAIRGFASIDYRLSGRSSATDDAARGQDSAAAAAAARHPDHIIDVRSALNLLAVEYGLTSDYILIGHSAGATLAFQVLMGRDVIHASSSPDLLPPSAVIGISGIYDLLGLDARHNGDYTGFISAAFGSDKDAWVKASPARYSGNFKTNWGAQPLAVVAWSPEDSLVDEPEIDAMISKLKQDDVSTHVVKDLTGDHNVVWEEGSQICRLVCETLAKLSA